MNNKEKSNIVALAFMVLFGLTFTIIPIIFAKAIQYEWFYTNNLREALLTISQIGFFIFGLSGLTLVYYYYRLKEKEDSKKHYLDEWIK